MDAHEYAGRILDAAKVIAADNDVDHGHVVILTYNPAHDSNASFIVHPIGDDVGLAGVDTEDPADVVATIGAHLLTTAKAFGVPAKVTADIVATMADGED